MDIRNPFPSNADWDSYRRHLHKTVKSSWTRASNADVEDAVSHAILDLLETWADYASSLTDNRARNYAYAFLRGRHKANEYLREALDGANTEFPFDPHEQQWLGGSIEDDYPCLHDDGLAGMVKYADAADLDRWLGPMLKGERVTDQAAREGLTSQAITLRRTRGMARLKQRMETA